MLRKYLKRVAEIIIRGDSREESFYSTLEQLLDEYANSSGKKNVSITTLPKKTEAGNPDFRIWDGKQHIIGYIEAKAPGTTSLDSIETTEQLKRYRRTFPNLILTNFFEFRLYRNSELIDRIQIGRPDICFRIKTTPPVENEDLFIKLLEKFFSFSLPIVYNARELAIELAKRTRFLRDEIISMEIKDEESNKKSFIPGFYKAFRKYLIAGLTYESFADLYSQTVTYGLFSARTRSENDFNRRLAYHYIPRTIGILRDVFRFISLEDLPPQMEWIIDDISEVLAVTDVNNILDHFFHQGKGKDPIFHFYETFLLEYDPGTREKRGVYYTPEPVVSYIVRSINHILKEKFGKNSGLADDTITILDPAAGTLTFMAWSVKIAMEEFEQAYGEGGKAKFIKEHILRNFYAFELLMAPYAAGHLKMSYLLAESGYKLGKNDRFKLYLTNTLEMEELEQIEIPGLSSLSEESHNAGIIKKEKSILVIMGNPPYSGHSSNVGKWISNIIRDYYMVDGKPLHEKNPKWLQDDYVKFIRFSQWKIDRSGTGVLGFITNHSFLDNPTFRGMRDSLMKSFNEIYILNLHGNSLKKEVCPDNSKDENVFEIRQGVSIGLFIKKKKSKNGCKVFYSDLWGKRESKYEWLSNNSIETTRWNEISPKSDFYLFVPVDETLLNFYDNFLSITDIFSFFSVGIVTSRDRFVMDYDKKQLYDRIRLFKSDKLSDEIVKITYKLKDKKDWKINNARELLKKDFEWEDRFIKVQNRPFDIRWLFYHRAVIERSRGEIMKHIIKKDNICLVFTRSISTGKPYDHVFCSRYGIIGRFFPDASCVSYIAPLYLFLDNNDENDLLNSLDEDDKKRSNINLRLINYLSEKYNTEINPDEIFYYIYGILHSDEYRRKYVEFVRTDFPRIPFTNDYKILKKIVSSGKKLVECHMLEFKEMQIPTVRFQGEGDGKVCQVKYLEKENRIYINGSQYFEGIKKEVWQYQTGGYQVCSRWLKDRKNRILSLEDIKHFCNVIKALIKTIEIQHEIDNIYPEVEKGIIVFPGGNINK